MCVCVCVCILSNSHSALVPPPPHLFDSDIEDMMFCVTDVTVAGGGIIKVVGAVDIPFVVTFDVILIIEVVSIGCVIFTQIS